MSAKQLELILALVETAGPLIVAGTAAAAKWQSNRKEVQAMIDEGRDPTPEEHRRLTQELAGLQDSLADAIKTATASE